MKNIPVTVVVPKHTSFTHQMPAVPRVGDQISIGVGGAQQVRPVVSVTHSTIPGTPVVVRVK